MGAAAPAPHHYDLSQMLVNFPCGCGWHSALGRHLAALCPQPAPRPSGSDTSWLRPGASRLCQFQPRPQQKYAGPRAPAQSLTSARAPAPITSADSRVHFPLAVPAQQREIVLSRSQDQILAASGSRRMEVIRSYLAAAIRNGTSLCGVPLGRCRQ